MAKYRKKPIIIEATQWFSGKDVSGVIIPEKIPLTGTYIDRFTDGEDRPHVITIHGQKAFLAEGDWILPEPDGIHFYPCKPDIFENTYELVNE